MSLSAIANAENLSSPQARLPFTERGALRLFVKRESFFGNLRDCIFAIASTSPRQPSARSQYFLRETPTAKTDYGGRSSVLSLFLHCVIVALLVYLPPMLPAAAPPVPNSFRTLQVIYYRVPLREVVKAPRTASMAPRKRSASKSPVVRTPKLPTAPAHPLAAMISAPAHPDNFRQTIYQSTAPPDLKIKTEQKLPNIVILEHERADLTAPLLPSYARPAPIARQATAVQVPTMSATNLPNPTGVILPLSESNPRLTIPVAGGGGPITRSANVTEGPTSGAPELVVVGVDPSDAAKQISLLNGNRWGEFAIAPPAQPSGPPTGTSSNGGKGEGSPGSSGHGLSASSGPAAPVDIAGSGNGQSGLLNATLAVALVYPVAQPVPSIRRNTMVISSGPIGGGGLNVYGALNCGKIYSIFLPMPGRNWSLQYCDKTSSSQDLAAEARDAVVHLEKPLVPPDVDLNHRYNFKRIAVPTPNANRPIILKGVIGTDGTVQKLTVYRGVSPELDEAARIAFGRWHFKPAMRDGKPVAVNILVGIPPSSGEDRINR
jgi:hypothetical protein